jgi:hypothetical protein
MSTETDELVKWFVKTMAVDVLKGKEISYNKQIHIMQKDSELLMPSEIEMYKFNLNEWELKRNENYIILIKK